MFSQHIIILNTLQFILLVHPEPVQYCLKHSKTECYPCEDSESNIHICDKMTKTMKIIDFRGSKMSVGDYNLYVNSHIKIIKEGKNLTFYSCDGDYFMVSRFIYYPLKTKLLFIRLERFFGYHRAHISFQKRLENYCKMPTNKFLSTDKDVDSLDFALSDRITSICLQNITTATIFSNRIRVLKENRFFKYAYNLVHLHLEFQNLQSFSCLVFRNLSQLRIVKFPFAADIHIESYKCILPNNRNLVKIEVGNITIWNTCDQGYGIGTKCLVVATEPIYIGHLDDEETSKSREEYSVGIMMFILLMVCCIVFVVVINICYNRQ